MSSVKSVRRKDVTILIIGILSVFTPRNISNIVPRLVSATIVSWILSFRTHSHPMGFNALGKIIPILVVVMDMMILVVDMTYWMTGFPWTIISQANFDYKLNKRGHSWSHLVLYKNKT